MATIRRRKSAWQVQIRRLGHQVSRTFRLRADAELWARQLEAELDRGGLPTDSRRLRTHTLADLLRCYEAEIVPRKRSADREVYMLRVILRHPVAQVSLHLLTATKIAKYRDHRLALVKSDSDVDLVFCDLPHVPPGAMGRFLLTQMASVAELEAGLISERTKAALAAAKVRGVKLGNPNGARALRGKQIGNKQAVAAVKANAEHRAANLRAIVDDMRSQGFTSVRSIAAQLNERGILTPRGGAWHPTSAARLLSRLQA